MRHSKGWASVHNGFHGARPRGCSVKFGIMCEDTVLRSSIIPYSGDTSVKRPCHRSGGGGPDPGAPARSAASGAPMRGPLSL